MVVVAGRCGEKQGKRLYLGNDKNLLIEAQHETFVKCVKHVKCGK